MHSKALSASYPPRAWWSRPTIAALMALVGIAAIGLSVYRAHLASLPRVATIDVLADGSIKRSGRALTLTSLQAQLRSATLAGITVRASHAVRYDRLKSVLDAIIATGNTKLSITSFPTRSPQAPPSASASTRRDTDDSASKN